MDIERANALFLKAINDFQESEIVSIVERSVLGGYSVPSPSKLGFKSPSMPVPDLPTGHFVLDKGIVRRLKKDFLTFMSSAKKAKNYEEALNIDLAYSRWSNLLREFDKVIVGFLGNYSRREDLGGAQKEAKVLLQRNKMKPFFNLFFPFVLYTNEEKRWGETKESLFRSFKEDFPEWEKKARLKARALWKWLRDVVDYTLRWSEGDPLRKATGSKVAPFKLVKLAKVLDVIAGFQVQMVGEPNEKVLSRLNVALREYKKRAASRFPILLRNKIRFDLNFEDHSFRSAASYGDGVIHISYHGLTKDTINSLIHMIAHEMGHHLFIKVISQHEKAKWIKFWKMDKETIDLNHVLAMQRKGEDDDDFIKRLQKEDPVLMMRVGAYYPAGLGYFGVGDIKDYISRKGNILSVSKHLPTSYSAENPNEFFAEVVGNLVGYGPRTVPKTALSMLRRVTGSEVKESLSRIKAMTEMIFKGNTLLMGGRKFKALNSSDTAVTLKGVPSRSGKIQGHEGYKFFLYIKGRGDNKRYSLTPATREGVPGFMASDDKLQFKDIDVTVFKGN